MSKLRLHLLDALFVLLGLGALVRLFHAGELNDQDFGVYWRTAHQWVSGVTPYLIRPEDQGFVIKYPPWVIPLFLPFAWLSWDVSRAVWYGIELACVFYAVRWICLHGVSRRLAIFVAYLYWWLWQSHFSEGQIELPILVAALWALPPRAPAGASPSACPACPAWKTAFITAIVSIKVFSLVTLAGLWRRYLNPRVWLAGAALLALSNAVLLGVYWAGGGFKSPGLVANLVQLYHEWARAAASSGTGLGPEVLRGQGNHGFTALVLRTFRVSPFNARADALVAVGLALAGGTLWQRFSRALSEAERWAGWIALGVVIHPLAWHHYFVLVYPLSAFSLAAAAESDRRPLVALSLLGTCCIGIFVPQVIGTTLVKYPELAGMKSWGVVLAAAALVRARASPRYSPPIGETLPVTGLPSLGSS